MDWGDPSNIIEVHIANICILPHQFSFNGCLNYFESTFLDPQKKNLEKFGHPIHILFKEKKYNTRFNIILKRLHPFFDRNLKIKEVQRWYISFQEIVSKAFSKSINIKRPGVWFCSVYYNTLTVLAFYLKNK